MFNRKPTSELVLHAVMGALLVSLMSPALDAIQDSVPVSTLPWHIAAIFITLLIAAKVVLVLSAWFAMLNRDKLMRRLFH